MKTATPLHLFAMWPQPNPFNLLYRWIPAEQIMPSVWRAELDGSLGIGFTGFTENWRGKIMGGDGWWHENAKTTCLRETQWVSWQPSKESTTYPGTPIIPTISGQKDHSNGYETLQKFVPDESAPKKKTCRAGTIRCSPLSASKLPVKGKLLTHQEQPGVQKPLCAVGWPIIRQCKTYIYIYHYIPCSSILRLWHVLRLANELFFRSLLWQANSSQILAAAVTIPTMLKVHYLWTFAKKKQQDATGCHWILAKYLLYTYRPVI